MAYSGSGGSGSVTASPVQSTTINSSILTYVASSGDEPSTESRMCTEDSLSMEQRMTSSTEGMLSLSEDSSGRDTYAQANEVGSRWNPMPAASAAASGRSASGAGRGSGTLYAAAQPSMDDDSDEQMNGILGSYREILVEDDYQGGRALIGEDTEEEVSNLSPDSGPMSPFDAEEYEISEDNETEDVEDDKIRPNSLQLSYSQFFSSNSSSKNSAKVGSSVNSACMNGFEMMWREGELVSFVAEDLEEQIKRASPVVKTPSRSSTPQSLSKSAGIKSSGTGKMDMSLDLNVLIDIESKAKVIASSVNTILENLTGTLHSMSSLTVDCVDVYQQVVNKTCDSIDGNIKGMYQLMAKFEELGNLMRPVYRLSGHIKELKRMLDLLEQVVASGSNV